MAPSMDEDGRSMDSQPLRGVMFAVALSVPFWVVVIVAACRLIG